MTQSGAAGDKVLAGIAEASKDSLDVLQGTTQHDPHVLHASVCGPDDRVAGYQKDDGSGAPVLFLPRSAGRKNQIGRTRSASSSQTAPSLVKPTGSGCVSTRHSCSWPRRESYEPASHSCGLRAGRLRGFCRGFCSLPVSLSYFYLAQQRHRDNPDDRVMPTAAQMVHAFSDAALKPAEEEETDRMTRHTVAVDQDSFAACYGKIPAPPAGAF